MDLNGTVINGHSGVNGKNNSHNGHHNGNGHLNGKDKFQNEYPVFQLQEKLTEEQKKFFDKNGFIHFKSFIAKDKVSDLLQEAESIQNDWVSKDYKMINGDETLKMNKPIFIKKFLLLHRQFF